MKILTICALLTFFSQANAQTPAAAAPKAIAPEDLTGYWVSVVTEDWRFRMVNPPKGDFASVPLNAAGRKVAGTWDPAKDAANGEQCRSYGAPAIMRVPGRFHIQWDNDTTLRIDADSGKQTRLFHFDEQMPQAQQPDWQGYSIASWDMQRLPAAPNQGTGAGLRQQNRGGALKVMTTHMRPGYLRKNGVPYSANTVLTEYYTRTDESDGSSWLIVTTIVQDPEYLNQPFVTSTHLKKIPDASGWSPSDCEGK